MPKPNHFEAEGFFQLRQVFGLHRFKLHRHLVDGTVKSVWYRRVFGLLRVRFRKVSLYITGQNLYRLLENARIVLHLCDIWPKKDYWITTRTWKHNIPRSKMAADGKWTSSHVISSFTSILNTTTYTPI